MGLPDPSGLQAPNWNERILRDPSSKQGLKPGQWLLAPRPSAPQGASRRGPICTGLCPSSWASMGLGPLSWPLGLVRRGTGEKAESKGLSH